MGGWVDGSCTTIILALQVSKLRHRVVTAWGVGLLGLTESRSVSILSAWLPLLNNPKGYRKSTKNRLTGFILKLA